MNPNNIRIDLDALITEEELNEFLDVMDEWQEKYGYIDFERLKKRFPKVSINIMNFDQNLN
jgi:hypothetical protein